MTKIPEEAVERMEALVRSMSMAVKEEVAMMGTGGRQAYEEAKSIVAMLPEPVDPLLIEARWWCAKDSDSFSLGLGRSYLEGNHDESATIRAYLAGARAQQAKLTPTVEPDEDGWIKHTPGDPMPCDGGTEIDVRFWDGMESCTTKAAKMRWSQLFPERLSTGDIIAWRPAR